MNQKELLEQTIAQLEKVLSELTRELNMPILRKCNYVVTDIDYTFHIGVKDNPDGDGEVTEVRYGWQPVLFTADEANRIADHAECWRNEYKVSLMAIRHSSWLNHKIEELANTIEYLKVRKQTLK